MQTFCIHLFDLSTSAKSTSISKEAPDLTNVPKEYHNFTDVFSKAKAEKLAPHQPYNLKIKLEEGTSLLIVPMYPLSQSKLEVLCNFLNDHLHTRFICPASSSHGSLVVFSLKKDKSLCLLGIGMGTQNPGVSTRVLLGLGYRLENPYPSKTHTRAVGVQVINLYPNPYPSGGEAGRDGTFTFGYRYIYRYMYTNTTVQYQTLDPQKKIKKRP